jgi:hypothetical protein
MGGSAIKLKSGQQHLILAFEQRTFSIQETKSESHGLGNGGVYAALCILREQLSVLMHLRPSP